MEFFVYDNVETYQKILPFNGNPLTRVPIKEVAIVETGAFWFYTDMLKEEGNINLNAPYVHIHKKMLSTNRAQFDKLPFRVNKFHMKYNPKTKCLEIKKWFFGKPIWKKIVTYYGKDLPNRKISALGTWYFNYFNNSIVVVLDYFSQKKNFKFTMDLTPTTEDDLVAKSLDFNKNFDRLDPSSVG